MRYLTVLLVIAASTVLAGSSPLPEPVFCPAANEDLLQYDDDIAIWLSWGGLYRGVYFELDDFFSPVPSGFVIDRVEFWFYHSPYYPWDTSNFYAELWSGSGSPTSLEGSALLTATHMSPVQWTVTPPCTLGTDFWVILNSELSAGGWPSIVGVGTPNPENHSFFSDDFMVWEPWIITGSTASDYFCRVYGEPVDITALDQMTWGLVKSSY